MDRVAEAFRFDDIVVRPDVFSVEKAGRVVALEPKSIRVLIYLIENRPRAITKEELLGKVWEDAAVTDNALTRVVAQLRKAIGDDAKVARYIETVPTLGYRFIADVAIAEIADRPSPVAPVELDMRPAVPHTQAFWKIASAVLFCAVIALSAVLWQRSRPADSVIWSGNLLGGSIIASHPRISPDGQLLAFRAIVDGLSQVGVMKPDAASWTVLTHDRENGAVSSVAWARDGSRIYFDREWGAANIYSIGPLGGEPRLVLTNAWVPETLPDGSLIALRPSAQGRQQLVHFWPDSGRLELLPVTVQSADYPRLRAFPDGKEVAVFGLYGNRAGRPRLFALDLASGKARDLADPEDAFETVAISADGRTVFALQHRDDVALVQALPRDGSKQARLVLSFPEGAKPLSFDSAPDRSLYMDQSHVETSIGKLNPEGGTIAEILLPQSANSVVVPLPGGEAAFNVWRGGRSQILLGKPGVESRVLLNTNESASLPGAWLGNGKLAFVIGRGSQSRLAIASVTDGRVVTRFKADAELVTAVAAAPDGQTIYYCSDGILWAQPVSGGESKLGGEPRKIGEGYEVAADPSGKFLYLMRADEKGYGLWRMPVAGGEAEKLELPPGYNLTPNHLSPAAVGRDGRVLLSVNKRDVFFYQAAIFDPARHSMLDIHTPSQTVVVGAGWADDGTIVVRVTHWSSSLWRYRMVPASPGAM
jgi:eukaryotic-like serine/threonine-protein kinase